MKHVIFTDNNTNNTDTNMNNNTVNITNCKHSTNMYIVTKENNPTKPCL